MKQWLRLIIALCYAAIIAQCQILDDCGRSYTSGHRQPRNISANEGRIINGKKTIRGAWPWQVSLQLLHPKFGLIGHWCGAVLIKPSWILTAAHCIENELFNLPLAALWTAVLGEWDRDVSENTEVHVPIDHIVIHERFHNYQNDIALMRLSRPVHFPPVCLPNEMTPYNLYPEISKTLDANPPRDGEDSMSRIPGNKRRPRKKKTTDRRENSRKQKWDFTPSGKMQLSMIINKLVSNALSLGRNKPKQKRKQTKCVATGWGRETAQGPGTATLLQAKVPLLDNAVCQEKYGSGIPIRMGHLCAGRLDGTTGTCVGDSGGPLQCSLQDGRWVLAGITSFGSGCARPGYPDVYTRLAFYVPWIQNQLAKYASWDNDEENEIYK